MRRPGGGRRAAGALSRRGRRINGRPAHQLSRLAGAGACLSAPAGPADCLRARARTRRPRLLVSSRSDRRSKAIAIDGWTALECISAAERTARAGACRSFVRGRRRFPTPGGCARSGTAQMGERHLPRVVSNQGAGCARRAGAAPAGLRQGADPARRAHVCSVDALPTGSAPAG